MPMLETTVMGSSCFMAMWLIRPYSNGQWEERSFVREGEAAGRVADMPSHCSFVEQDAVYQQGARYINCYKKFVMRYRFKISLSNEKYRVIKPPHFQIFIWEIREGFHIYILDESCGEVKWVSRHFCYLGPIVGRERIDRPRSLILQEYEDVTVEGKFDWDSDNDDVIVPEAEREFVSNDTFTFLGFHPYREIVFLSENSIGGLAYHLSSSKVQSLGHLCPKHDEERTSIEPVIEACFLYTPWMGRFFEEN
uniref:Uncharacterized protein n=1 Tax=Leersia perrieri TaxID=77586 RepID=A0A0D9XMA4_9ORYZ